MDIHRFVEVTATNPAKIYGLYPRKGTIEVGCDADLAVWDPEKEIRISIDMLHDNMDYTPYEGTDIKGWPETVISRGRIVVEDKDLKVDRGTGVYLKRTRSSAAKPSGKLVPEVDSHLNFNAKIL